MKKPTHKNFKEFKKAMNLKNKDIALIIGLTENSVKNQTAPSKELPTWAIAMIYVFNTPTRRLNPDTST